MVEGWAKFFCPGNTFRRTSPRASNWTFLFYLDSEDRLVATDPGYQKSMVGEFAYLKVLQRQSRASVHSWIGGWTRTCCFHSANREMPVRVGRVGNCLRLSRPTNRTASWPTTRLHRHLKSPGNDVSRKAKPRQFPDHQSNTSWLQCDRRKMRHRGLLYHDKPFRARSKPARG